MYEELASVYEFLVPDAMVEPEGAVAAFAEPVEQLEPGARVLDCSCGTGELAVGLALRGFDVAASDASPAMVARTQALAAARGVELAVRQRRWDELEPGASFDAVFCVGNSLIHAAGRAGRRSALAAMGGALRAGGLLVLTSRNWERLLALRQGLEVDEALVERGGRRGLVARAWTFARSLEEPHGLEIAVALLGDGAAVEVHRELLAFWPFTEPELLDDLRASGFEPVFSSYEPEAERYLVSARRRAGGGAGGAPPPPSR